jgi:K+-transporting ATPase ATPase B chain
VRRAVSDAFVKLDPRHMVRNPVMFVVLIGSAYTTVVFVRDVAQGRADWGFTLQLALWLWFTVVFANFAEAMAEGRGKAQADTLRRSRTQTTAKRLLSAGNGRVDRSRYEDVSAERLRKGDLVLCLPGDIIPGDGEVIDGVASVDESAITGESAPVIRESGGDRSAVTGGTRVLSDYIVIRITANPGETFLDRMIALVEGASAENSERDRTDDSSVRIDNRLSLSRRCNRCDVQQRRDDDPDSCCPPRLSDSDDDRRSAVRDRYCRHGSHDSAKCDRHERPRSQTAGDVNTLLLTRLAPLRSAIGKRRNSFRSPVSHLSCSDRAQLASLADETPEDEYCRPRKDEVWPTRPRGWR